MDKSYYWYFDIFIHEGRLLDSNPSIYTPQFQIADLFRILGLTLRRLDRDSHWDAAPDNIRSTAHQCVFLHRAQIFCMEQRILRQSHE